MRFYASNTPEASSHSIPDRTVSLALAEEEGGDFLGAAVVAAACGALLFLVALVEPLMPSSAALGKLCVRWSAASTPNDLRTCGKVGGDSGDAG